LNELGPIPNQVTQRSLRRLRNVAGFEQTTLQQLNNPFGVFDVCLAARTKGDTVNLAFEVIFLTCSPIGGDIAWCA
jgi:hypothetical protein